MKLCVPRVRPTVLTATWPLSRPSLLLRVDNAGDASYQWADTYATAGRALLVGLRSAP